MKKTKIVLESAKAFKSSTAFAVTFSVLIPFILWLWKPDFKLPLWSFVMLGAIYFLTVFFLGSTIAVLYKLYKKEQEKIIEFPKLAKVREEGNNVILVFQNSPYFNYHCFVSVYLEDDNNDELLLALGKVTNIQEKMMQIQMIEWQGTPEIYQETISNNKHTIGRMIIKPYVTEDQLVKMLGGI